jgi:hypothetical protein
VHAGIFASAFKTKDPKPKTCDTKLARMDKLQYKNLSASAEWLWRSRNVQNCFRLLNFDFCYLFVIWKLYFGALVFETGDFMDRH